MKNKRKIEKHERMYGPHFNEEMAMKAVSYMENEDGTTGAHWSIEQTNSVASQYGINLSSGKFNKYDWFVAMNMLYSDYYRAVIAMTNSDNVKYYVDLSKAWLEDKDVDEGKMWYYYKYVMCDKFREDYYDEEDYEDYDEEYYSPKHDRRSSRYYDDDDYDDERYTKRPYAHNLHRQRYISRY